VQGGSKRRNCTDQILVLRGVCELRKRRRRGTYLAFLPQKFVRVCQSLYEGVEASIVLDGEQSRWFQVEKGLRQGCTLSPLLYSIM